MLFGIQLELECPDVAVIKMSIDWSVLYHKVNQGVSDKEEQRQKNNKSHRATQEADLITFGFTAQYKSMLD